MMTDHVLRDFDVREQISKQAISAADASAKSMCKWDSLAKQGKKVPSPRNPKVDAALMDPVAYALDVSIFKFHNSKFSKERVYWLTVSTAFFLPQFLQFLLVNAIAIVFYPARPPLGVNPDIDARCVRV